jgi:tetratricopeptide (TPR) repeat protein
MGFLQGLFAGTAPSAEEARTLFVKGRNALWMGEPDEADAAFARAARGPERRAAAMAYRSLALRMKTKFSAALKEADAALALDPECLEAYAARAAALLSLKRLVDACLAYREVTKKSPYDRDAHALRLLMVSLFAETIANAKEDADGMRLDFQVTPATRCAIRTLDGRAALGLQETARLANSTVAELAMGAAYYFAGSDNASDEWARALEGFPDGGGNDAIRASLLLLTRPA